MRLSKIPASAQTKLYEISIDGAQSNTKLSWMIDDQCHDEGGVQDDDAMRVMMRAIMMQMTMRVHVHEGAHTMRVHVQ